MLANANLLKTYSLLTKTITYRSVYFKNKNSVAIKPASNATRANEPVVTGTSSDQTKTIRQNKETKPAQPVEIASSKLTTLNIKSLLGVQNASKTPTDANSGVVKRDYAPKQEEKRHGTSMPSINLNELTLESALDFLQNIGRMDFDKESGLIFKLKKDPKLKIVIEYLLKNEKSLTNDELIKMLYSLSKLDTNYTAVLTAICDRRMLTFDANQVSRYIYITRKLKLFAQVDSEARCLSKLVDTVHELTDFNSIMCAMRVLESDKAMLKELNSRILELSDKWTRENWLDLLERKSIQRDRDSQLLQTCLYHLNTDSKEIFTLKQIQRSLLSIGILKFIDDEQFIKSLLTDLNALIEFNLKNKIKLDENSMKDLSFCIKSIGVLSLRDTVLINNVCDYLVKLNELADKQKHDQIIQVFVTFCITCANCNIHPVNLKKLVRIISFDYFENNLETYKDCLNYLNYVWSLCTLGITDTDFIMPLLDEQFWKQIVDQEPLGLVPFILKLLQINLYAMTHIDGYTGPDITANLNLSSYRTKITIGDRGISTQLTSTLSSFLPKDKFFKTQLLLPYGIIIDAFLIVNKMGEPVSLDKFLNAETGDYDVDMENYFKIALKVIDFKDFTLVDKKQNGFNKFQFDLIKHLDYIPVPVTHQDINQSRSITERVELLKQKFSTYVKNRDFKESYMID